MLARSSSTVNRWFADKNYYFTQIYGEHKNTDNPDQRIAEDILLLISKTLSLSFGFIQSLSMLITFTVSQFRERAPW